MAYKVTTAQAPELQLRNSQPVTPKVSVLMLVYQHGEFVSQAISSVLSQVCDFEFELIIINDCSNDGSGKICRDYASKHSDRIKFIDNQTNLGMHDSFARLWNTSDADLIAFCEGDDYWVDEKKLQVQVDSMQQHSSWMMCGAKAQIIERSDDATWFVAGELKPTIQKSNYAFEELIGSYCFHFSTVMVRKSAVTFPDWFKTVYCVDRPIYLLAAQGGRAGYLNKVVSAYRIHPGGNWSSCAGSVKAVKSADLFGKLSAHFDKKYRVQFELALFDILHSYVATEMQAQRYDTARRIFAQAFHEVSFANRFRCFRKYYRTAVLLLVKR